VVSYVVESHDTGGSWTDADLVHLGHTLTDVVLGAGGVHPEYLDGSGSGNGWIADGFVKLGRYDEQTQRRLQLYGVQNAQFYAAMAVNAKVLSERGR
jgi:hypothetical protein